jgi:hypothetical protein
VTFSTGWYNYSISSHPPEFRIIRDDATRGPDALVSNFGDIGALLPASLGLIVFLAWIGWRQDVAADPAAWPRA